MDLRLKGKTAIMRQAQPHSMLQRFLEPAEIAYLVTYLSSPLSIASNGSCFRADGGALRNI